jgi:hypothetical protein
MLVQAFSETGKREYVETIRQVEGKESWGWMFTRCAVEPETFQLEGF